MRAGRMEERANGQREGEAPAEPLRLGSAGASPSRCRVFFHPAAYAAGSPRATGQLSEQGATGRSAGVGEARRAAPRSTAGAERSVAAAAGRSVAAAARRSTKRSVAGAAEQ